MRHKEPEHVTAWRDNQPPKCCHTCEHYSEDGLCTLFNMEPPEEFAATHGQCGDFSFDIPF